MPKIDWTEDFNVPPRALGSIGGKMCAIVTAQEDGLFRAEVLGMTDGKPSCFLDLDRAKAWAERRLNEPVPAASKAPVDPAREQRRFEAAKAAMQGLIERANWSTSSPESIARGAVTIADALLAALEVSHD